MLARLQQIEGVVDARVEPSGHVFLVEIADGAAAGAEAEVVAALGRGARRLTPEDAEPELASLARGERWYGSGDVRALSAIEGRIVVDRVTAAVAGELSLDGAQADALGAAVRDGVFAVLHRMQAEGLPGGTFLATWPETAAAIAARAAGKLPGVDGERLREALARRYGR